MDKKSKVYAEPHLFKTIEDSELPTEFLLFKQSLPPQYGDFYYAIVDGKHDIVFCLHKSMNTPQGPVTVVFPLLMAFPNNTSIQLQRRTMPNQLH